MSSRLPESRHGRRVVFVVFVLCRTASAQSPIQAVDVDAASGIAAAVIVDGQSLVHTTQLLPTNTVGQVHGEDVITQTQHLISRLSQVLERSGSDLRQLVRLNIYAKSNEVAQQARRVLVDELLQDIHPAVTIAVGTLSPQGSLVAIDAVAALAPSKVAEVEYISGRASSPRQSSLASVVPPGRVVYVSGMAARVDDLEQATTQTMEKLHGVLKLLDLTPQQVVHLKAFMKPVDQVDTARRAMQSFYSDEMVPPMTFVEWENGLPIEIEMIVFASSDAEGAAVTQNWQPNEKRSPVFCRYAIVNAESRIFVSGLNSSHSDPVEQSREIFRRLDQLLVKCGSDLNHLAKATYYVTTDAASRGLNAVRPEFYDPQHPPAASKASIPGTGWTDRAVTVDMIAVPAE